MELGSPSAAVDGFHLRLRKWGKWEQTQGGLEEKKVLFGERREIRLLIDLYRRQVGRIPFFSCRLMLMIIISSQSVGEVGERKKWRGAGGWGVIIKGKGGWVCFVILLLG